MAGTADWELDHGLHLHTIDDPAEPVHRAARRCDDAAGHAKPAKQHPAERQLGRDGCGRLRRLAAGHHARFGNRADQSGLVELAGKPVRIGLQHRSAIGESVEHCRTERRYRAGHGPHWRRCVHVQLGQLAKRQHVRRGQKRSSKHVRRGQECSSVDVRGRCI